MRVRLICIIFLFGVETTTQLLQQRKESSSSSGMGKGSHSSRQNIIDEEEVGPNSGCCLLIATLSASLPHQVGNMCMSGRHLCSFLGSGRLWNRR